MTEDKDVESRIKARTEEEAGASHTTSRSHIVDVTPASLPENYEELAGMSDASLAARTGRSWPEWVEALDRIGAMEMEHGMIARWVQGETGLDWWAQTVAVGYERIRGLRDVGQSRDGGYSANKSRTFSVPVARIFEAFADEGERRRWLDEDLTVRKATPHKSVRITWSDGSNVEVYLTDKGAKSTVQIQHGKLLSRETVEQAKAFWSERLEVLATVLEG